jgi:type II secretory ATPase GspE/PulE/Tfp pilus assembly ATPase PilB-like protein
VKRVAVEQGMYTLRDDGLYKAASGVTSIEEIARVVSDC